MTKDSLLSIEKSPGNAAGYVLHAECMVPRPIDEGFGFFSDAFQLEKLTPPKLGFRVVTQPPIEIRQGTLIDYRLRLLGIPARWTSEITFWDPPLRFVDQQRRGPYRFWRHENRFEAIGNATRVIDHVEYSVPGGSLAHWLFVRRDLERVFRYRQEQLAAIFSENEPGPP